MVMFTSQLKLIMFNQFFAGCWPVTVAQGWASGGLAMQEGSDMDSLEGPIIDTFPFRLLPRKTMLLQTNEGLQCKSIPFAILHLSCRE
jgi:hypothetical protein